MKNPTHINQPTTAPQIIPGAQRKQASLLKSHHDPAMRYESLARAVFGDCPKGGDPWGYSMHENFAPFFVPEPKTEGKRALSTILCKLIYDHSESRHVVDLKKLDDQVWEMMTPEQITAIIDQAIEIAEKLGY